MDLAHEFSKVAIALAQDRFEEPLKKMTDLLVLSIVILTVTGEQTVHNATDRVVKHLNKQMDVVRHQAISVEVERPLAFLGLEKSQKLKVVIEGAENRSAIVAARNDVIQPAG